MPFPASSTPRGRHTAPPAELVFDPASVPLVTLQDLAVVARVDPVDILEDDYAKWCIDGASLLVRGAGDPAWTMATAPPRARLICVLIAKRAYVNPDGEIRTNVGPLGASVTEVEAAGMRLTDAERAEIASLAPEVASTGGRLWVQPFVTDTPTTSELYLFDSSLSDWLIPYIDSNDIVGQRVMGAVTDEG